MTRQHELDRSALARDEGAHFRRVRRAEFISGAFIALVALAWAFIFAFGGSSLVVIAADCAFLLVGLLVMLLAHQGKVHIAAMLMVSSILVVNGGFSLFIDMPTQTVPRSHHIFNLPLGVFAYLFLTGAKPWVRHGMSLLCFALFVFFSATNVFIVTEHATPASVRGIGYQFDIFLAMALTYVLLELMQTNISVHAALENELRRAFKKRQFLLYFQPQVDTRGQVIGVETLLRWAHPVRGVVSPQEFIGVVEQINLIVPLGYWAMEEACQQLAVWAKQSSTAGLSLSVNVSAEQLRQKDFVQQVHAIVQRTGAPPQRLKLEITESVLVANVDEVITKMAALRESGLRFSLDDFGTGYSSLNYLKRMPLDQLKIDQSFVRELSSSPADAAITRSLLSLGRSLGLAVIAEGVESKAQWQFLVEQGCEAFQGYLFGRPEPLAVFERSLERTLLTPLP